MHFTEADFPIPFRRNPPIANNCEHGSACRRVTGDGGGYRGMAPNVRLTLINARDPAFDRVEQIYRLAGAADKLTRK